MSTIDLKAMLPWSQEAEQSSLGAFLRGGPAAFEKAQPLQARQFFDQRHALIYAAIASMTARKEPIDVVTVFEDLKSSEHDEDAGGLLYLSQLEQSVPSAHNVHRYAQVVRDKAGIRALREASDQANEVATEPGGDVASKLDAITSIFGAIQRQQLTKAPKSMAEMAMQRTAHYEALQAGTTVAGWPTHIPRLDILLNGGFRPGSLIILAARPSVGKSSFSQWLAHALSKQGLKTLFLSLEMSCEELADRMVASAGRVDYSALQTGRMNQDHWARTAEVLDAPELRDFFVDDQAGLTLMDIRAKAKQVPGLKVLVLDYLQLCSGSGGSDSNRNSEIEQISRGLKTLAKELGITIIALSQLNRQVEQRASKRPMLSDLRDSGAIEQDADVVMFLWPVREFGDGAKLLGLGLDKNRQGKCGEVALHFDGSMQRWGQSTESLAPPRPMQGRGRGMSDDD
jgi:replicative DNA helicase